LTDGGISFAAEDAQGHDPPQALDVPHGHARQGKNKQQGRGFFFESCKTTMAWHGMAWWSVLMVVSNVCHRNRLLPLAGLLSQNCRRSGMAVTADQLLNLLVLVETAQRQPLQQNPA